jgi:hypothetical protein
VNIVLTPHMLLVLISFRANNSYLHKHAHYLYGRSYALFIKIVQVRYIGKRPHRHSCFGY